MIHEANRSYIAGPDGAPALAIDTTGMDADQRTRAAAQLTLAQHSQEYNALPWYQQLPVAADDVARLMANGATFGYADKLAALAGGGSTVGERYKTQTAMDRAGSAGLGAEVLGAALPAVGLTGAGVTAGSLVPKALGGVPGFLARTGASAADAASYGALSAAGHDQDIGRGALTGAAIGAASYPAAEAAGSIANKFFPTAELPAAADAGALKQSAADLYKQSEDAGVIVKPEGLQRLYSDIKQSLFDRGYHPQLQPKVGVAVNELNDMSQNNVTLKGLDVLRRMANAAKTDIDPSTRMMGGELVSKLDSYMANLKPADVLSGDATQGVNALMDARKLWQTARKTETVDDAVERATNQAAATGSGGNIDNAIRQQFKTILNGRETRRLGWTPDELDAVRTIVRGTTPQNIARLVGKLSPEGNGLSLLLNLGGAFASGGYTLPLSAAGIGAKALADRATPNNVYALARIIASGGDASKVAMAQKAAERLSQPERKTLARVLSSWGVAAATP